MTESVNQLQEGEFIIEPSPEHIYRQITKHLLHGDAISSQAFLSSVDKGAPSYSRSSIVSAQESRNWHTVFATSPSLAVCTVTVEEVSSLSLNSIDDSGKALEEDSNRAPGHCYLDCRSIGKREMINIRSNLLRFAIVHGIVPTSGADTSLPLRFESS